MPYSEIVAESEKYRVSIIADEDPCEPDVIVPLVKIENGYPTELISDYAEDSDKARSEGLANAIYRWGTSPSDRDFHLVEKYMRAFWDVPELLYFYSDGIRGWYVGTDKGTVDEYQSWCEGDVWLVQAEEKISVSEYKTITRADGTVNHAIDDYDEWEEIEIIGGYIGREYAEQEAKDMFDQLNKEGK